MTLLNNGQNYYVLLIKNITKINRYNWCPHTDSNREPIDYKSIALPIEL